MKQLLLLAAVVSMAASGCVGTSQFVKNKNCGPACQMAQGQNASHSNVMQTAYHQGPNGYNTAEGLTYGLQSQAGCQTCQCGCDCCSDGCCCDGGCCDECNCGYPQDCSCGCAEDCCCGDCCCEDTCCGDGCCDEGSGCCISRAFDRLRGRGDCDSSGSCGCNDGCGGGNNGCGPCQRLAGRLASGGCCPHSGGYPASYNFAPGPQSGQTAYPYYTTRGPRDFLMCNPQPLGPY